MPSAAPSASLAEDAGPDTRLPARERIARLRLARSRNVGPRTFLHLLRRFSSAEAALDALPTLAARGGSAEYRPCTAAEAEDEVDAAAATEARLIVYGDADYPAGLARIDTPPPVLWLRGRADLLQPPALAIVGARNASALGLRMARRLAADLGEAGWIVVSGLARGIDAAAHEAALDTGTVAVLAGGVDVAYPQENAALMDKIAKEGALLSEARMGTEATNRHFPKRNRLVAGLGAGVLLIEAANRSGSLITARFALDHGREVMAVPGAPEDPRASGCNALIRDGAALIRDAEDVIDALGAPRPGPLLPGLNEGGAEFTYDRGLFQEDDDLDAFGGLDDFDLDGADDGGALADQIMRLLGPTPVELDEIGRLTGAAPGQLALAILELELAGRVDALPGGRIALAAPEAG